MSAAFADGVTLFFLPTNLLAIAALGLMVGQGGRFTVLLMLLAGGLVVGCIVIATAIRETPAPLVLQALAACAGAIVVLAWNPPQFVSATLALAGGIGVALNTPPRALMISSAVVSQFASVIAALAVFAAIAFIAAKAKRAWQRIGVRVAGSWIVASAILVLALRLAR